MPARKIPICLPISSQSVLSIAVIMVSRMPFAHVLNVFAANFGFQFVKKAVIPVPIDFPKLCQSNVSPKEFKNSNAVFKLFAIVRPTFPKSLGEINPLRKFANPLPKFLALL